MSRSAEWWRHSTVGRTSLDAGSLLLQQADRRVGLLDRLAGCFEDGRDADLIEHSVRTLLGQRVFGMALAYEGLNDHDQLRSDPLLGAALGKLSAQRSDCEALAGKSTLNRLEPFAATGMTRYQKIRPQARAIEGLLVDLFLEAHAVAPAEIGLDLATDDPLHGEQEGRFFHGYYDGYCYLPLYIFLRPALAVREAVISYHALVVSAASGKAIVMSKFNCASTSVPID